MAGLLDELRAQYEAIKAREQQEMEKAKGNTLVVEKLRLENAVREKDARPAERAMDVLHSATAERLRHPENERKQDSKPEPEKLEKPTQLTRELRPPGSTPGPDMEIPGIPRQYGKAATAEAAPQTTPQPDRLSIFTIPARDGSSPEPMPHERLGARLQKSLAEELADHVRTRREAKDATQQHQEVERRRGRER